MVDQFCFWDAKSIEDTYIMIINTAVALVITMYSCGSLLRLFKLRQRMAKQHWKNILTLNIYISCWGITFLIQSVYSIVSFFVQLNTSPPPLDISDYSFKFCILDKIPPFMIQTIFLTICFFNYQGLMATIDAKTFTKSQLNFMKVSEYFFKARIVVVVAGIMAFVIFSDRAQIWTSSTVNVGIELADSIITCIILVRSLKMYMSKLDRQSGMELSEKKKVERQYKIMIVTSILGVLVNITFLMIYPLTGHIGQCMQPVTNHLEFSIGHTIFGISCLYFIPLLWIMYVYRFSYHLKPSDSEIYNKLSDF